MTVQQKQVGMTVAPLVGVSHIKFKILITAFTQVFVLRCESVFCGFFFIEIYSFFNISSKLFIVFVSCVFLCLPPSIFQLVLTHVCVCLCLSLFPSYMKSCLQRLSVYVSVCVFEMHYFPGLKIARLFFIHF